jgi:hypothetical protein
VPGGGRELRHVEERGPADVLARHQRRVHRLEQQVPGHLRVLPPELDDGVKQHRRHVRDADMEHLDDGPGPQRAGARHRTAQVRDGHVEEDLRGGRVARDHVRVRGREQALGPPVRCRRQFGRPRQEQCPLRVPAARPGPLRGGR